MHIYNIGSRTLNIQEIAFEFLHNKPHFAKQSFLSIVVDFDISLRTRRYFMQQCRAIYEGLLSDCQSELLLTYY